MTWKARQQGADVSFGFSDFYYLDEREEQVKMLSIRAEKVVTATTTNVFQGTDLEYAPGPGAVAVWGCADQVDWTASIRVGGKALLSGATLPQRTGYIINENDSAPLAQVQVDKGDPIRVDVVEVTGGNGRFIAIFMGEI